MPKAVVILANGFEEIEAFTPIDILRRGDIEVTTLGLSGLRITSAQGVPVHTDGELKDFQGDSDALILPGGGVGAENLSRSSKVEAWVEKTLKEKKLLAAICASPGLVLAKFLEGIEFTTYPGYETHVPKGTYLNQSVVRSGNIITAMGPAMAIEFSLAILDYLQGKEQMETISKAILFSA